MNRFSLTLVLFSTVQLVSGQTNCYDVSNQSSCFYQEHMYLWQPDTSDAFIRQAYVVKYNYKLKVAEWAIYHLVNDYLETPSRSGKYKSFRRDPDVDDGVVTSMYTGSGYARGHLVPFFASGGDRDHDGKYSDYSDKDLDKEDDKTIYQVNYMSNITPQDHSALNGAGAPWYKTETMIRKRIIKDLKDIHIVLGAIVSDMNDYPTVENKFGKTDIAIPDKFYQIIVHYDSVKKEHQMLALLFPHVREKEDLPYKHLEQYVVPVDSIETLTGLDFFDKMKSAEQTKLEKDTNLSFWLKWFK